MSCIFLFFIIDQINLININPNIFTIVSNPFNQMIRFTTIGKENNLSFDIYKFFEIFFSNFKFDKILILFLLIIFTISIIKDFKKKN